jgi:hypothetical protein
MPSTVKPTPREVLSLLGLQLGIGAVAATVLALLPLPTSPMGWVGALAAWTGAQTFATLKQKKQPGRFVGRFSHWLAIWAAIGQLVAAGLLVGALAVASPESIAGLRPWAGWLVLLAVAVGGPLVYGLTRGGISAGLRSVKNAQKADARVRRHRGWRQR